VAPPGHTGPGSFLDALGKGQRALSGRPNLLDPWNPASHAKSKQLRRMSRLAGFAFVASSRALREAGLATDAPQPGDDLGLVFATVHGATAYLVDFHRGFLGEGLPGASPLVFANGVTNAPTTHVSIEYAARGRCLTFTGGDLGAFEGIAEAAALVRKGTRAVLVCAGEEMSDLVAGCYRRYGAAAGARSAKALPGPVPLCEGASALVLGPAVPGAPGLVLESWAFGGPSPDASDCAPAVEEAIRACLERAHLTAEDPDLLVCSLRGDGGDRGELAGISAAFRGRRRPLPAASPAAALGEGFAFTALIGVVAGLGMLERGAVPPCAQEPPPVVSAPLSFPRDLLRAPLSFLLAVHRDAAGSAAAVLARLRKADIP
jgi:3-oxoacyl-(acyl-carrier-protein) synthase